MADKHTQAAKQSSSKHSHQASFQPSWGPAHRRIPWKQELSTHRETHSERLVKRLAFPHKRALVGRGQWTGLCFVAVWLGRGEVRCMPEFAHVCMCAQSSGGGHHSNRAKGLFSPHVIVVV